MLRRGELHYALFKEDIVSSFCVLGCLLHVMQPECALRSLIGRAEEQKQSWTELGVLFSYLWLCLWDVSCSG